MSPRWLLTLVLLIAPSLSLAQAGFGLPSYNSLAIPVTIAEAEFLASRAELDAAATAAVKSLAESCLTGLRRDTRRYRFAVERAHVNHPREERDTIRHEIDQAQANQKSSHEQASRAVLADLQALLPEGSADAWAAFERRRHRRLYLFQSPRVGACVDLIEIAAAAKVADLPTVKEALAPYEIDLDRLLLARFPIAIDHDQKFHAALERGDDAEAERLYTSLRDADCAIIRLQRSSSRKLLDATPAIARDRVLTLLIGARGMMGDHQDSIRTRAKRLIDSGRLDQQRLDSLRAAVASFDAKSRDADDRSLTAAEDAQCARTFAQSRGPMDQSAALRSLEEDRQLRAALLAAIEKVATEQDLDAIELPGTDEPE